MDLPQILHHRREPRIKQLKKELSEFYEKKTEILSIKFGVKVKKIGHGYFLIERMANKNIPANILENVERYPSWIFFHHDLLSH